MVDNEILLRAHRLGMIFLEQLEKSVASGMMDESESWLWGSKENAVSLWIKISGNLLKLAERGAVETPPDSNLIMAEDKAILERYIAVRKE